MNAPDTCPRCRSTEKALRRELRGPMGNGRACTDAWHDAASLSSSSGAGSETPDESTTLEADLRHAANYYDSVGREARAEHIHEHLRRLASRSSTSATQGAPAAAQQARLRQAGWNATVYEWWKALRKGEISLVIDAAAYVLQETPYGPEVNAAPQPPTSAPPRDTLVDLREALDDVNRELQNVRWNDLRSEDDGVAKSARKAARYMQTSLNAAFTIIHRALASVPPTSAPVTPDEIAEFRAHFLTADVRLQTLLDRVIAAALRAPSADTARPSAGGGE